MKKENIRKIVDAVADRNVIAAVAIAAFMAAMPPLMQAQYAQAVKEWSYIGSVSYLNIVNSSPYGRMSLPVQIYKLSDDGSATKDFYAYKAKQNPVPGKQAFSGSGSDWVNDWMSFKLQIAGGATQTLKDHDPITDSSNPANIAISIPFSLTYEYGIVDVSVTDKTDYGFKMPWWEHDFCCWWTNAATSAYTSEPAFTVEVNQNDPALVDGWYHMRFEQQSWTPSKANFNNPSALFFDSTMV